MERRIRMSLWGCLALLVGCSVLPDPVGFPFEEVAWQAADQHYDNLSEIQADTSTPLGYNRALALNLCRGRYSFAFERLERHNPEVYVDLIIPTLPQAQRLVLGDEARTASYSVDMLGSILQIIFTASYQAERFLFSWQALSVVDNCPRIEGLPLGLLAKPQEVLNLGNILPPGLPAQEDSPSQPNDKKLEYIVELAWNDYVDLDLGSQLIGTTPRLDWRNPSWSMPRKTGFLVADRNGSCLSASREGVTEEFHWSLRLPPDEDTSRYDDDLRFLITYQNDCSRRAINSTVRYDLNIITYVDKPVYTLIEYPPLCELAKVECRQERIVSSYAPEKIVLVSLRGCEIRLGQTLRFALRQIQDTACEELGEDVSNDPLLSGR